MGKPLMGSIDLTLLLDAAKAKHTAFVRAGKKNHIFVNVTLWENDTTDEFGNTMSLQVNPNKDDPDKSKENRFYIGNFKPSQAKPSTPLSDYHTDALPNDDDLPF
jgi:hypothetical protein